MTQEIAAKNAREFVGLHLFDVRASGERPTVTRDDAAGDVGINFELVQRLGDFFHETIAEGIEGFRAIERDHRQFLAFTFLLYFDELEGGGSWRGSGEEARGE